MTQTPNYEISPFKIKQLIKYKLLWLNRKSELLITKKIGFNFLFSIRMIWDGGYVLPSGDIQLTKLC